MSEAQGEDGQKKPKKPRGPRTPKLTKAQRDALDEQMPDCLTWDPEDIAHWISTISGTGLLLAPDFYNAFS